MYEATGLFASNKPSSGRTLRLNCGASSLQTPRALGILLQVADLQIVCTYVSPVTLGDQLEDTRTPIVRNET